MKFQVSSVQQCDPSSLLTVTLLQTVTCYMVRLRGNTGTRTDLSSKRICFTIMRVI